MTPEIERSVSEFMAELIDSRVKIERLEQQLSDAIHLFYASLSWILTIVPPESEPKIARVVRFKILQMAQGCPLGQRLIELDEQNGGLLESKGILLSHWVWEPREKQRW